MTDRTNDRMIFNPMADASDLLSFGALAMFIFIVKFLGWVMRTKKEEVAAPPPPTKDQELLAEIRDLLKRRPA